MKWDIYRIRSVIYRVCGDIVEYYLPNAKTWVWSGVSAQFVRAYPARVSVAKSVVFK